MTLTQILRYSTVLCLQQTALAAFAVFLTQGKSYIYSHESDLLYLRKIIYFDGQIVKDVLEYTELKLTGFI